VSKGVQQNFKPLRNTCQASAVVFNLAASVRPIREDGQVTEPTAFEKSCAVLSELRGDDRQRLHAMLSLWWDYTMTEFPEKATYQGYLGQNARWTDLSLEAIVRRQRELEAPMGVLLSLSRETLGEGDRLNYDLFRRDIEQALVGRRFPAHLLALHQIYGVHQSIPQTLATAPSLEVKDFEDRITRLKGVPLLVDQTIALLRRGLQEEITPPQVTLRHVPQQVMKLQEDTGKAHAALASFRALPSSISAAQQKSLRTEALAALRAHVLPALGRLHGFLENEYLPKARTAIAWESLPDGKAWYAYLVRRLTTMDLDPKTIHKIGMAEVNRIRGQIESIIAEVKFPGSVEQFFAFLQSDPQFFFDSPEALLVACRDLCKRIDPELVRLFGKLPRLPYGVKPVPSYAQESQFMAYYERGSLTFGRPGYFFVNTHDLKARPKWQMEALALHEAVPGHHLQVALAQELEDMPEVRKYANYTAYIEGWALYAEHLGQEIGLYHDPYQRFGQLAFELWRAIRLVVDTGMHSFGWSRAQAIAFFKKYAPIAERNIIVEIDRYLVMPAQALTYKLGELKILGLREEAQRRLGSRFDIRKFHDWLLGDGALPLDVLESRTRSWLDAEVAKSPMAEPTLQGSGERSPGESDFRGAQLM
jgi:uncharacterized protein (DUF885 family)